LQGTRNVLLKESFRLGPRKKLKRIDRHVTTTVAGGLDSNDTGILTTREPNRGPSSYA
jgi:hypothetical protein